MTERDVCVLCGAEAEACGPPPHVHLTCVLKTQLKPDYPKLMQFFSPQMKKHPNRGYIDLYMMGYDAARRAARKRSASDESNISDVTKEGIKLVDGPPPAPGESLNRPDHPPLHSKELTK